MFVNNFDPVAFEFFGFAIRWYSLAYIFGLVFAIQYGKYLIKNNHYCRIKIMIKRINKINF